MKYVCSRARILALIVLLTLTTTGWIAPAAAAGLELRETSIRRNFLRMEKGARIQWEVFNATSQPVSGAVLKFTLDEGLFQEIRLPELTPGARHEAGHFVDTGLRAGDYELKGVIEAAGSVSERAITIRIVERPLPHRMPVVMWGHPWGGDRTIEEAIGPLKAIGFTHALTNTGADEPGRKAFATAVWEAGKPVPEISPAILRRVDEALGLGFHLSIYASPARTIEYNWADPDRVTHRIDRDGERPGRRYSVCGLIDEVRTFCYNMGASMAEALRDYPALDSALVHTEIRDHTELCFHDHDREAFRQYAGIDIPAEVEKTKGVDYRQLDAFPADRIIADDHPILTYYRWFWKQGDGWNDLHTLTHQGLQSAGRHLWTWFDPTIRAPSVWGSGGEVDYVSHWTYTYPNPEVMGFSTDDLFAMARGSSNPDQDVMKMTNVIWYRSAVAPAPRNDRQAQWEKDVPADAPLITMPPDILALSFWSKISRPVKGIMYHGLQSLLYWPPQRDYWYTNSETKDTLRHLVKEIIEPLGPTLVQVPDADAEVAFLKSFTSEMFAGRGAYGWGGGGTNAYLVLRYAQLQPDVVYEETILEGALDDYRVLVLTYCDVLPKSVAAKVRAFQASGGIVVGDEYLAPGIIADVTMTNPKPSGKADAQKAQLLHKATELRAALNPYLRRHLRRRSDSDNPDILTRVRHYGVADYLFAYNDKRQFGDYIGHHGLVMDQGVPAQAVVKLHRAAGHVYDLLEGRRVDVTARSGWMHIAHDFGGGEGRLWMITPRRIKDVTVDAPATARRGGPFTITIAVVDDLGKAVNAIMPVRVEILDGDGDTMEFSGHYGAKDGTLEITFDIAPNDKPGEWTVRAVDLAAGTQRERLITVE